LLVTADSSLLDDLLRLAAAAGAEVQVAHDLGAARSSWAAAPLVVLGPDCAGAGSPSALRPAWLTRRADVVLVGEDRHDPAVWQRAVELGAAHVIFLPDAEGWLVERFADAVEGHRPSSRTFCVLAGRGGAGASTLAAALAITGMRRGCQSLLIDGDPLGGGIDLLLGGEDTAGLRWPDFADAAGRVSAQALHDALPRMDALTILSWDRGDLLTVSAGAMQAVLAAAQRGNDLVVVDLPRSLDAAAEHALNRCDVALMVVPAEVRATASAARVATAAALVAPDLRVVVRGPSPAGLEPEVVAEALGLPLAGFLRPEPGLAAALERGEAPAGRGRGPLAEFCASFLSVTGAGSRRAAA
jgi:secretion/DNA translocation related CpaE-like protein